VYESLISQLESDASLGTDRGLRLHFLRVAALVVNEWLSNEPNARLVIVQHRLDDTINMFIVALRGAAPADMRAIGMDANAVTHAVNVLRHWV